MDSSVAVLRHCQIQYEYWIIVEHWFRRFYQAQYEWLNELGDRKRTTSNNGKWKWHRLRKKSERKQPVKKRRKIVPIFFQPGPLQVILLAVTLFLSLGFLPMSPSTTIWFALMPITYTAVLSLMTHTDFSPIKGMITFFTYSRRYLRFLGKK